MHTGFEEFINSKTNCEYMLSALADYTDYIGRTIDYIDHNNDLDDMPATTDHWRQLTGTIQTIRQAIYWLKSALEESCCILTEREKAYKDLIKALDKSINENNRQD